MEGSETESERFDSDGGGDEQDSKGLSSLLDTAASGYGAPAASGVPTPWNNVLALAQPHEGSLAAQSLAPPVALPGGTFVSPFQALHSKDSLRRGAACPRCSGSLDNAHIPGPPDDVELMFCVCCKRPMPLQQLSAITKNLKRCAACVVAGRSIRGLLDALKAELPGHLRKADYIAAVVKKQENAVLYYNAPREQALKFNAQNDPRIVEVNALAVAHYAAMADHIARRRALFRNPLATLDDTNRLFDEWVVLEKQRVSNNLQRLVVLDDLLASHFLPSTPKAIQLMRSLGLVPADPFPMTTQYDTSEQCGECDILLSPPAPVAIEKLPHMGFCDCCKRMLPRDEMHLTWAGARISFCQRCKRRRDFSLKTDGSLEGIPTVAWCRDLSTIVRAVSQRLQQANCLEGVAAARFTDAQQDVTRYEERVDGLKRFQAAVIHEGNTPMAVSRHWYAEQSLAFRGMEAALFKQLLLCTEAGVDGGLKVWAPVVKYMRTPQLFRRRSFPEWLTTFVNDRWPPSAEQGSASISTDAPKPKAQPNPSIQVTEPPQSHSTWPVSAVVVPPLGSQASGGATNVGVDHKCERCEQVLAPLHGTGQPSVCDCCELVLPQSHTQTRLLHPRVSLCSVCFEGLSKTKSLGEIVSLVKRPNADRINQLQSFAGTLKHLVDTASALEIDESVDTRRLSAVQEVDSWKLARKQLRKRQTNDLLSKKASFETRRKLYVEHIETDTALLEALVEFVQVHLELISLRNIKMSKKFHDTIVKSLDAAPSVAELVASEDRSETERRPTRVANEVVEPPAERKGHGVGGDRKEPLGAQQLNRHARGRDVVGERVVVLLQHEAKNSWGPERKVSPPQRGMDERKHKFVNNAPSPTANKSQDDRSVRLSDRNADHTRRRSVSPEWTTSRFENDDADRNRPRSRSRSRSRSPRYQSTRDRERDRDRSRSRRRDRTSTHGPSRSWSRSSPRYSRDNERDRSRSMRRDHTGIYRRQRSRSRSRPRFRDNERGRSRSMRRDLTDPQRRSRSRSRSYERDRSRSGPRNSSSNMKQESRPIDDSSRTAGREPMKDEKRTDRSRSRETPSDYAKAEKKPRYF